MCTAGAGSGDRWRKCAPGARSDGGRRTCDTKTGRGGGCKVGLGLSAELVHLCNQAVHDQIQALKSVPQCTQGHSPDHGAILNGESLKIPPIQLYRHRLLQTSGFFLVFFLIFHFFQLDVCNTFPKKLSLCFITFPFNNTQEVFEN